MSRPRNTTDLHPNFRDNADDERRTPETIAPVIASSQAQVTEKKRLRAALVAEVKNQAKVEAEEASGRDTHLPDRSARPGVAHPSGA
jgi:hypothetical protein